MQRKIPPQATPAHSANDNGPLSSGQVKALKMAIAIMGFLIVAALLAIVGRVIYLSAVKKKAPVPVSSANNRTIAPKALIPKTTMTLPSGAIIKSMSLQNDRLLVHYETAVGSGAAILDLVTGKTLSEVSIATTKPDQQ